MKLGRINYSKLREERKLFYSKCCKSNYESKSNGLWTYYVCEQCKNKTEIINGKGKMLDLYGRIKRYEE